jgi:hypothetical protein
LGTVFSWSKNPRENKRFLGRSGEGSHLRHLWTSLGLKREFELRQLAEIARRSLRQLSEAAVTCKGYTPSVGLVGHHDEALELLRRSRRPMAALSDTRAQWHSDTVPLLGRRGSISSEFLLLSSTERRGAAPPNFEFLLGDASALGGWASALGDWASPLRLGVAVRGDRIGLRGDRRPRWHAVPRSSAPPSLTDAIQMSLAALHDPAGVGGGVLKGRLVRGLSRKIFSPCL